MSLAVLAAILSTVSIGTGEFLGRDDMGDAAHLEAVALQPLAHDWKDDVIGIGAGVGDLDVEAAASGAIPEECRRRHALGGAVWAEEQNGCGHGIP